MDTKRFALFIVLSMGVLLGWQYIEKKFLRAPKKPNAVAKEGSKDSKKDSDKKTADAKAGADKSGTIGDKSGDKGDKKAADAKGADGKAQPAAPKKPVITLQQQYVQIGSPDPETGLRLNATLSTIGASIDFVELNDKRYRDLSKKHPPLKVVGPGEGPQRTFQTNVLGLGEDDLQTKNWEVVEELKTPTECVFRYPPKAANSPIEVLKKFSVQKVADSNGELNELPAYELLCEITFQNKSNEARNVQYELQGPVGLPLENVDNAQKFRDLVAGFYSDKGNGAIDYQLLAAASLGEQVATDKVEEWKRPAKYLGVDVQYFCALLMPQGDQQKEPYFEKVRGAVSGDVPAKKQLVDSTLVMSSKEISVPAAAGDKPGSVTHSFKLFLGPKRGDLLEPLDASRVIDYGWFGWISRPMLSLLKTFYGMFGSYGIAIICLTIVVRGCMFPISIRQARSAAVTQEKMAKLQPELNALKEKYGNDKEKFFKAQMELFAKHNYNPLQAAGGCLLVFLQLPVFMGLYNALNHAVELRLAKFLWIENLAAPDALFHLPFTVPFLGWTEFNLLPIITVILYVVQQKMLMPPPMNEEQAMQQKMMNYMMIFMGAMFYRVPAGLCVYFIASSLWGLAERKLLPKVSPAKAGDTDTELGTDDRKRPPEPPSGKGRGSDAPEANGFLARLLRAADKEVAAKRSGQERRK